MKKYASLFQTQFPSAIRGRRGVGRLVRNFVLLGLVLSAVSTHAASVTWTGAVDTNWSNGGNWSGGSGTGGVPGATDNVAFGPVGAGAAGAVSNVVDGVLGNFAGTIGSLQYTNAANFQNTLINPGITLNVTGATVAVSGLTVAGNALMVGQGVTGGAVNATISGPGATLNVSNSAAEFIVSQGSGTALLDMTNLDTFTGYLSRLGVGVPPNYGWNVIPTTPNGVLRLAKTNFITTSFAGGIGGATPITNFTSFSAIYGSTGREVIEAIEVGNGADNAISGTASSGILLGQANTFNVDSIGVGKSKSAQSSQRQFISFNPVFINNNPSATFRGTNGGSTRVAFWSIGDNATSGSSSTTASGLVDFTGGTVDAKIDQMYLGIDKNSSSGTGPNLGTLTFTAGTVDVNTLVLGAQESPSGTSAACAGVVNLNGSGTTLSVNSNLVMGVNVVSVGNAGTNTFGTINVTNGAVKVNNVIASASTLSPKNLILLINASLTVSNSLATNAGTVNLTMTNSALGLTVPANGSLPALVRTLTAGGATNVIQLAPVPVFASYPQLIPLVQYTTLNGSFNFGLTNVPASAPGAYLSNITVVPKSIALYLPSSPAPVITSQPGPFSGVPGATAVFTVNATGNPTLGYQWYETDGVSVTNLLTDTVNGTGSTNSGSTTSSLTILNAQPGDNGGYFVVITNGFGSITSTVAQLTISSGNVAPSISGLNDQTVIAGNTAVISASVAGSPTPTLKWQFNGTDLMDGPTGNGDTISGSTTSALTITSVQYPSSQGQYSLVASNIAGVLTNSMTLTVTVPPSISVQPTNVVVINGQPASFSVTLGAGVPAPTYQWRKNGVAMSSVTNPSAITSTLTFASTSPSDIATYTVLVVNSAGSQLSGPATLTVNSTMVGTPLSPVNGATGVRYDTPLYLSFDRPPTLNNVGKVTIFDASTSLAVDTVDLTQGSPQSRTIGGVAINTYPVIITGNTAAIYPHSGVMTFGKTYYVTVDDGVFTDSVGAYFAGIADTNAWRFSTKPTGPVNSTNLVVAADGTGDFLTVQGAADFIPNGNTNHVLVNILNGTYTEVVRLNGKNNVTFRGQNRQQTIVTYANNNNINAGTSTRPMFGILGANDVAIENITLTNSTPKGGSQAETLYLNVVKRFILNNAFLASFQDTLLVNANGDQAYFNNNLIQGDTDFIWGLGTAFFTNCEIRTMNSGSGTNLQNITQARTNPGTNGFSFVNCQLTRLNNTLTLGGLGRSLGFVDGNVAYINCLIDAHIVGWQDSLARSWEFGNSNITATAPVSYNGVQLAANDPNLTNAETATLWLYGWQPQLAPNILTQPVSLSVSGGQPASFSVTATGIPNASYQWLKNGNVIANETGSSLTITNAYAGDVANYSVVVSNAAGVVTSGSASLAVGNTAPTLNPIGDVTINAGQTLTFANVASDPDVPTQTLTFSLPTAPAGANVDMNSGVFTWRPLVSQAGTFNPVTVQVSDNGSPILSASQSFNVTVNPLVVPTLASSGTYSGGQFTLTVNSGTAGPDYTVLFSTDLTNWTPIFTNDSATPPFTFTDTNASASAMRFYRIQVGP